jgi:hypothetical protein
MIAIGLNLILGVLLLCALILGVRLERKLRGLKDSNADFVKAVSELDQAAGRTEHSLAALRAGTETAKSEVASRVDQARVACQRLEKLVADADKAADRLSAQPLMLVDRAPPPARPVQAPPPAPAPSAIARPEPELMWADDVTVGRPAPAAAPQPAPAPLRSRAKLVDDDLFAHGPPPAQRQPAARRAAPEPIVAPAPPPLEIEEIGRNRPAAYAQPARPDFVRSMPLRADNDPIIGAPRDELDDNRAAREAFFREMIERDEAPAARDPFVEGRFAHERRAMLAAVMGGRR